MTTKKLSTRQHINRFNIFLSEEVLGMHGNNGKSSGETKEKGGTHENSTVFEPG